MLLLAVTTVIPMKQNRDCARCITIKPLMARLRLRRQVLGGDISKNPEVDVRSEWPGG